MRFINVIFCLLYLFPLLLKGPLLYPSLFFFILDPNEAAFHDQLSEKKL